MKLFLITLACLCAVASAGFSLEEKSVNYKNQKALTDKTRKAKKEIDRQTLTLADEDNKECNEEQTDKFKGHGFTKERTNKIGKKQSRKNTLTLNQERERDWEKEKNKTYRRDIEYNKNRRSVSCSSSRENNRSSSEECYRGRRRGRRCGYYPYNPYWGCGFGGWGRGYGKRGYGGCGCGGC